MSNSLMKLQTLRFHEDLTTIRERTNNRPQRWNLWHPIQRINNHMTFIAPRKPPQMHPFERTTNWRTRIKRRSHNNSINLSQRSSLHCHPLLSSRSSINLSSSNPLSLSPHWVFFEATKGTRTLHSPAPLLVLIVVLVVGGVVVWIGLMVVFTAEETSEGDLWRWRWVLWFKVRFFPGFLLGFLHLRSWFLGFSHWRWRGSLSFGSRREGGRVVSFLDEVMGFYLFIYLLFCKISQYGFFSFFFFSLLLGPSDSK